MRSKWTLVYVAVLITFTLYIALDTFILSSVVNGNATDMNTSMFQDNEAPAGKKDNEKQQTNKKNTTIIDSDKIIDTYEGDNISITLGQYREYETEIYVADIYISSCEYLKSAFAKDTYGKNITEKTSVTAANNDAVLAINGDYYGVHESGYVIRNGVVYRDSAKGNDILCIYSDGSMEVVNDKDYSADELVEKGVWQAYSFGPGLVTNGSISVTKDQEVGKAMASNPRTAIGLIDNNHFVFVVSDGRTDESEGLSLYQLAEFMTNLGIKTAYNLDGGGSSTMYFNGNVINKPVSRGSSISERGVSDIVYIGE